MLFVSSMSHPGPRVWVGDVVSTLMHPTCLVIDGVAVRWVSHPSLSRWSWRGHDRFAAIVVG